MVNGKRRDDCIKAAQLWQRAREIVFDQFDTVCVSEAPTRVVKHQRREIKACGCHSWPVGPEHRYEPALTGAEIKYTLHPDGNVLAQHPLTLEAVGKIVSTI
jgi:hypothetical protein